MFCFESASDLWHPYLFESLRLFFRSCMHLARIILCCLCSASRRDTVLNNWIQFPSQDDVKEHYMVASLDFSSLLRLLFEYIHILHQPSRASQLLGPLFQTIRLEFPPKRGGICLTRFGSMLLRSIWYHRLRLASRRPSYRGFTLWFHASTSTDVDRRWCNTDSFLAEIFCEAKGGVKWCERGSDVENFESTSSWEAQFVFSWCLVQIHIDSIPGPLLMLQNSMSTLGWLRKPLHLACFAEPWGRTRFCWRN